MKKLSPDNARTEFERKLTGIEGFCGSGLSAFGLAAQKTSFMEQNLLATAVAWETFISDLFFACMNRRSARFAQHLRDSVDGAFNSASSKQRLVFSRYGTLSIPAHISVADLKSLCDEEGQNLTFSSAAALIEGAGKFLVPPHAALFDDLTDQQRATINALIKLRNYVAHRSDGAHENMNTALAVGALHPLGLRRGANKRVDSPGVYLRASTGGGTRFSTILTQLRTIAQRVAPPNHAW